MSSEDRAGAAPDRVRAPVDRVQRTGTGAEPIQLRIHGEEDQVGVTDGVRLLERREFCIQPPEYLVAGSM